jgi:hypothetical protein
MPPGDGPDGEQPQVPDLRLSAAERAPGKVLPAAGAVWTAAEIMHAVHWPPSAWETAAAAALAATTAWGAAGHGKAPAWLPGWLAAAGAWVTVAAAEGPLHWLPYVPLTAVLAAGTVIARWQASRHPSVTRAREQREARAEWLSHRARHWGLGGSHLLRHEQTRLGEMFEADTKGTRRRASQLVTPHLAELVAEDNDLPTAERVRVTVPRPGRIRISIRHENPWEHPVPHPLLDDAPEIDLSAPYSIRHPAVVGMDPETGNPLLLPLFNEFGARRVSVVALSREGKTILLNCVSERVTAAPDALMIRINLSIKGPAETHRWGPACHLTAFGTSAEARARAVRVLRTVNRILEWRSLQYTTAQYAPAENDPGLVIMFDEVDSAMSVPAIRKQVEDIATKGGELGAALVRLGQRGTADYSSAKTRSQDDVIVMGRVGRASEMYHAAGNLAMQLPDMSAYGEGAKGVWGIAHEGGAHMGRSFRLESEDSARLAEERAYTQPELPAACREFLGDDYENLLATDVFPQWARDREAAAVPVDTAAAAVTPPAPVGPPGRGQGGDFDRWDRELDDPEEDSMDPDARATIAGINRKLGDARRVQAETAALPGPPDVSPEALDAFHAERWLRVAEETEMPDGARPVLVRLLAEGTTVTAVATELGIKSWPARKLLEKLRQEGVARLEGKGRAARWLLAEDVPAPEDGDEL